jgi:hypothetical protein
LDSAPDEISTLLPFEVRDAAGSAEILVLEAPQESRAEFAKSLRRRC